MAKRRVEARAPSMTRMVDLAALVSDRVQIKHIILAESVARRRALYAGPPAELSLKVHVKTKANEKDNLVQVFPRFTLIGRDGDDGADELLRVEALFVVQYRVPTLEGITEKHLSAFGELNGVYNVWPYWREFVQSMTVRMGLPSLTIPVFRPLGGGVSQPMSDDTRPESKAAKTGRRDTKPRRRVGGRTQHR